MHPKLISFGTYYLPTYGVLVAIAFLTALYVAARLGVRAGMDKERVTNLGIYCALVGLLGAKLLMIVFDWGRMSASEIFSVATLQAAGVFHGGLVAALVFAVIYTRRFGMPWLRTADVYAPAVALGHSIGRLGCFMAGCCYGTVCDRPWAVTYTNQDAGFMSNTPLHQPLHPTQLYEAAAEMFVFGLLWWRSGRPHRPGGIIGLYLIVSSVFRIAIEYYRFHDQALPFGLPFSLTQWISAGLIVLGLALLVMRRDAPADPNPR